MHSNTQTTPTSSVVYTSNKNTRQLGWVIVYLETRDLLLKIRLQVNLSLGYNLKPDIYDSRLLCLNQFNLITIVCTYGVPLKVHTDQGLNFDSKLVKKLS